MISFPRVSGLLCAALLTLASARGESARFELRGILDFGGGQSFSLHDRETGAIRWLEVGRSIGGYRIEAYDAGAKILTLASGEETLALALKVAEGIPLEVLGSLDEAWVFSQKDIDPDTPGEQSYQLTRSKLRFEVGSRQTTIQTDAANEGSSAGGGRSHSAATTASTGKVPAPAGSDSAEASTGKPSLSNSDRVAVEVFEKNYIATREAPGGVDIFYSVGPR